MYCHKLEREKVTIEIDDGSVGHRAVGGQKIDLAPEVQPLATVQDGRTMIFTRVAESSLYSYS